MRKFSIALCAVLAAVSVSAAEVDLSGTWRLTASDRSVVDRETVVLLPGRDRTLVFTAKEKGVTAEKFRASFSVKCLNNLK